MAGASPRGSTGNGWWLMCRMARALPRSSTGNGWWLMCVPCLRSEPYAASHCSGWCSDVTVNGTIASCAGRAAGGGGSSNGMGPTMNVGGLLSTDPAINPRFANYSLVFLHVSGAVRCAPTSSFSSYCQTMTPPA